MGISEENTRTNITIPKELKRRLEELAKKQNRSLNNLIITTLLKYVEQADKVINNKEPRS